MEDEKEEMMLKVLNYYEHRPEPKPLPFRIAEFAEYMSLSVGEIHDWIKAGVIKSEGDRIPVSELRVAIKRLNPKALKSKKFMRSFVEPLELGQLFSAMLVELGCVESIEDDGTVSYDETDKFRAMMSDGVLQ